MSWMQVLAMLLCEVFFMIPFVLMDRSLSSFYWVLSIQDDQHLLLFFATVLIQAWVLGRFAGRALGRTPGNFQKIALWYAAISIIICTAALWSISRFCWKMWHSDLLVLLTIIGIILQLIIWQWGCRRIKKIFIP